MRELSVPAEVTVADGERLSDMVIDNAREVPELVSFGRRLPAGEWVDVTAAAFAAEVIAVARGLIAAGVRAGDRVALMSKTRYEWTLLDYAIWSAGAVTVPIYETSSAEQVEWILADSGAVAAFVETDAHRRRVEAVRDRLPALRSSGRSTPASPSWPPPAPRIGDAEVEQRRTRGRGPTTWPRSSTPAAPPAGPRAAC